MASGQRIRKRTEWNSLFRSGFSNHPNTGVTGNPATRNFATVATFPRICYILSLVGMKELVPSKPYRSNKKVWFCIG